MHGSAVGCLVVLIRTFVFKLDILVVQLLLHELLRVPQLREGNFFFLDLKGGQFPLLLLFIPVGLLFNLKELLFIQQVTNHLIQEVDLLALLPHRVQQLFVLFNVLFVEVLQLLGLHLVFLLQFLYYFPAVFNFLLQIVVVLLLLEQCVLLPLLLLQQLLLFLLLLF